MKFETNNDDHVPKYIGYDGKIYDVGEMSTRHLRQAVKGFRRAGFVPTTEYVVGGLYKPMAILDFLERELKRREAKKKTFRPGRQKV